uniref:RING-type domain-containing protein n=1 Tax=Astatotilapia calliptera TaxID=8154 RepID=A0AAX7UHB4_ASTCA
IDVTADGTGEILFKGACKENPVCRDVYRDPVILSCSHSFCRFCLRTWWSENLEHNCPLCFLTAERSKNFAVSEPLCSLHHEKLKLFCLDHQQLVYHRFNPTEEAAQDHREELQKHLKPLQDKMKLFEQVKSAGIHPRVCEFCVWV